MRTKLSNPYSKEELMHLERFSRIRPLSTLKALIKSVEVNNYRTTFAIVLLNSKGEFTEDDIHFINMDLDSAYYVSLSVKNLDNRLNGIPLFKITKDQAKELRAAELISGCLKTALIHLVNGLEDSE